MSNQFKPNYFFFEKLIRKKFSDNEIFFNTYYILLQSKYSTNLIYFAYKRRLLNTYFTLLKNRCILTNNPRSVYSHLKLSKIAFSRKLSSANMPGFYRSI